MNAQSWELERGKSKTKLEAELRHLVLPQDVPWEIECASTVRKDEVFPEAPKTQNVAEQL